MVRLEHFVFGYLTLTVKPECLTDIVGILIKNGCVADVAPSGEVRLPIRSYKKISPLFPEGAVLSVGEERGLGGAVRGLLRRTPSLIALILCAVLYFLSGEVVSDVRVSGNEALSEGEVVEMLRASGLEVGDLWQGIDKNAAELALLSSYPEVAWISVNRVGSVAYVEISERQGDAAPPNAITPTFANIVAACDCVIEEITVVRGTGAVKVGETVRKGDLLISGIIESDSGTKYVAAEGIVRGSTAITLSTETQREHTERLTEEGETAYITLKILKIRINLLNNYGNLPSGYAIIDDVKECTLMGKRIPVSILVGKYAAVTEITRTLTDAELASLATLDHRRELSAVLLDKDLTSIRTEGGFYDGGYRMTSHIVYSTEVGVTSEILTQNAT